MEAYRQASASQKYAAAAAARGETPTGASSSDRAHSGLTLDEACRILNVKTPDSKGQLTGLTMEEVTDMYKRLFDNNDPKKGGSFYIQSKVVRAKERVTAQMLKDEAKRAEESPGQYKVYKE